MTKREVNEKELDADPSVEASADDCDATPLDCEKPLAQDDRQTPGPSFMDEIQDTFNPHLLSNTMVAGSDGLPVQASEDTEVRPAPRFHYDTVVCIEDDRQWVEQFKFDGEPNWYPLTQPILNSSWAGFNPRERYANGEFRERRTFPREAVKYQNGVPYVVTEDGKIPVRPIRPQCIFYKRQLLGNDSQPDPSKRAFAIVFRNCTARRSIQGADMSVRDEAVYACEHRKPYDKPSMDKFLIGPDQDRLNQRPVRLPVFNIT